MKRVSVGCWLKRCMVHGMQRKIGSMSMDNNGFIKSRATPCMFYHEGRGVRLVIHGTALGREVELDWFLDSIKEGLEVKFRARLGPEDKADKSIRLLNRVISWTPEGIRYEADQRHAELVIKDMV